MQRDSLTLRGVSPGRFSVDRFSPTSPLPKGTFVRSGVFLSSLVGAIAAVGVAIPTLAEASDQMFQCIHALEHLLTPQRML